MKSSVSNTGLLETWEWHYKYANTCGHGVSMPKHITDRAFNDPEQNMGINGGLMMLKPSKKDFEEFLQWLKNNEEIINKMNWPDMQSITAFYSGDWVGIDAKYLGLYGYPNIESLSGIHFVGPKPWQWRAKGFEYRIRKYPDYRLWVDQFLDMLEERPQLASLKKLQNLNDAILKVEKG